jgi:hypothetical protein
LEVTAGAGQMMLSSSRRSISDVSRSLTRVFWTSMSFSRSRMKV